MSHKHKKQFGQNFLKDPNVFKAIVQSTPKNQELVVEIGCGLGDLTTHLLDDTVNAKEIIGFEIDTDLRKPLNERFASAITQNRLRLEFVDALQYWQDNGLSLNPKPYHLIANLPYYVATALILRAIKDVNCQSLVVLIQKEVAQKFCADVGDKAFSALSIIALAFGGFKSIIEVPSTSFDPPPKVQSSVIQLSKSQSNPMTFEILHGAFEPFLACAFQAPRKTLLNNLSKTWNSITHHLNPKMPSLQDKSKLIETLKDCGIDPKARPHEVSHLAYYDLYNHFKGSS